MKQIGVRAVHERDIEDVLGKLGYLDAFNEGKLRCAICNSIITIENLQILIPHNGIIDFYCSTPECFPE